MILFTTKVRQSFFDSMLNFKPKRSSLSRILPYVLIIKLIVKVSWQNFLSFLQIPLFAFPLPPHVVIPAAQFQSPSSTFQASASSYQSINHSQPITISHSQPITNVTSIGNTFVTSQCQPPVLKPQSEQVWENWAKTACPYYVWVCVYVRARFSLRVSLCV